MNILGHSYELELNFFVSSDASMMMFITIAMAR